jgi:hypothetical protein
LIAGVLGLAAFTAVAAGTRATGGVSGVMVATLALHGVVMTVLVIRARRDLPWRAGVFVPGLVAAAVVALGHGWLPQEGPLALRVAAVGGLGLTALIVGAATLPEVRSRWRSA